MAQEEKSALKEAIKAVKERKNELKLQQKTISNLKAEIAKVEQQKAKDAKRKAELKLQIDTMLHTIEERRALRKIIEQYSSDAEAVQQETWMDLLEVEEQLQTVSDGVELVEKSTEYHKDCIKSMIDEFNNMKLQLSNAVSQLDAVEQQKHQKEEAELISFQKADAEWLTTIEKEIDEIKTRIASRDDLNRQKEERIAHRKEELAQLRSVREERLSLLAKKKMQTKKALEELDVVSQLLIKAKEREHAEIARRDAAKERLETSQAKRAELMAEKLEKNRLRQEHRADHEAKIREIADKIVAERNAINDRMQEQSDADAKFSALFLREKTEFETIRQQMADEASKLKSELNEDIKEVMEMRAEIAGPPTADELRALADQLRAEVREMIEMNVKLAQEEKALEERENIGGSPMEDGHDHEAASTSCSRRLVMSVGSQSQQLLSPMLRPLSPSTPPKRIDRASESVVDRPSVVDVKTRKRSTNAKNRKSNRLATPKQMDYNKENAVDLTPIKIPNGSLINTPNSPSMQNDDSSQTSDASMWSPLRLQ